MLESDAMGTVSMAPAAMTTKELPIDQGEVLTIKEHAPRLSSSAAMADRQPVAATPVEQQVNQDVYRPAEEQARRVGALAAMVDPQPVAPVIVKQSVSQGEYRPAMIQSPQDHAPSIGPKVPADESIYPAIEIRRKPLLESPDGHQTSSPSRAAATDEGIDKTSQEQAFQDHQSKVAVTISEHTLLKPAIERVETEKPVATQLQQQPVAPLHSRLETRWGKKNETMQIEKSTPTIHVTIGRIEVRATPAPIQNQPRPKAPDTMSLDEYLRRRNGGGR